MNREGFEKWADDRLGDESNRSICRESWQAAINSLEVTPELIGIGMRAEVGPWSLSDLVADPNYLDDIVESVLTAVFNAIKERSHV